MRKSLYLLITILIIVLLTISLVACINDNSSKYTLELVDKDVDFFEFTVGEIDWSKITFYVYDSENVNLGEYTASESMVVSEDLSKLNSPGMKTVKLRYQGADLMVTFKLNAPIFIPEYDVVFNAGEGCFANYEGQPSSITIREDVLEAIPTPVRDGYEFLGWYEDVYATGTKIITPYTLKRNLSLFAKWSDQRKYNVSYVVYEDDRRKEELELITSIEHGTVLTLRNHQEKVGFLFDRYEIINRDNGGSEDTIIYDGTSTDYSYTIRANLEIRLRYVTRMITLTFISDAWPDNTVINNVNIIGGRYETKVPYNTILQKDILPIPTLPEKEGYDGVWIDNETSKEPVYTRATTDILVTAKYTIKYFTMSFYNENNVLIDNATRTIAYNQVIDNIPNVPDKTGYNGAWKVINRGYIPNAPEGELVVYDLNKIKMKENVNVFASYEPKQIQVTYHFKMEGMQNEVTSQEYFQYGDVIDAPIDLTLDRVIDGVEYQGYDGKYYEILWYNSPTLAIDKLVRFPVDVRLSESGTEEHHYYFELTRRPYVVEFRLPDVDYLEDVDIDFKPQNVKNGDYAVFPNPIIEGYEVIAWYYNAYAPEFDATVNYNAGDYVFYNGAYYSALQDVSGILPTDESKWMIGANRVRYPIEDYKNAINGEIRIPISDFHQYDENAFFDRAFYAEVQVKQFSVSFENLVIGEDENGYVYSYNMVGEPIMVNYATVGIANIAPSSLTKPYYPDGVEGEFIFEGWYTDNKFTSLAVDLTKLKVIGNIVLYAKWSDVLIGTEGIIYTPDDVNNPSNYTVTGFNTSLAEYSHITLRIPAYHNGKPVVAIGDNAFANFDKTLFIDEVIISSNVTSIGKNAFTSCYSLQKFNVDESNFFAVDQYGVLYSKDLSVLYSAIALNSKENMKVYTIPQSVNEIVGGAFANLSKLEQINFEGISIVNQNVVGSCNLTTIGDYAFDGCISLNSIIIPSTVNSIGNYAFRSAYSLESINIDAENSMLLKVGEGAFVDCMDALTISYDSNNEAQYVKLGNVLVSYIGDATELVLDNTITAIADGAFNRTITDNNATNYQLSQLTVGAESALTYIGKNVFLSCASLNEIYILTESKVNIEENSFNGIALSAVLYVNSSIIDDYKADDNYLVFEEDNILGA